MSTYRAEIAKIVIALGEYYDKKLSPTQIAMYTEDLADIRPEDLARAVRLYRNDPKNPFFPLPSKLKAMIAPPETPEDVAREAAGRIVAAVANIGPYRSQHARNYIGELGWQIVVRQGGWLSVCESLTFQNQGTLQAQWRDLGASIYRRSEAGTLGDAPALPGARTEKPDGQLVQLGTLLLAQPKEGA